MPIFEYVCKDCEKRFEALVFGSTKPECPACHSKKLDQQLSTFAVSAPKAASPRRAAGPCGSCGHPDGPGSCSMN